MALVSRLPPFPLPPPAIILLSFVLALGFLLVILSCALYANWLPLFVALTFVLAPVPNSICARCAGADDYSADYNSAYVDLGHWLTAGMVVMGLAMPITLAHAGIIADMAGIMSLAGGGLVYGTSESAFGTAWTGRVARARPAWAC